MDRSPAWIVASVAFVVFLLTAGMWMPHHGYWAGTWGGAWVVMMALMLLLPAAVIGWVAWLILARTSADAPERILERRLAGGDITPEEYAERMRLLRRP